jgi:predicted TIM-barrel fold metal-dependent hydrolase
MYSMIIDSHCHAGAGFGLTDFWSRCPLLEKYLRRARAAGITHSVLFANFHHDYAVANGIVAEIVRSQPHRFYGLAYVHSLRDRGRIDQLIRTAVEAYGFVGIKVHRHDARISSEICEVAREFSLPVLYDVMDEVSIVDWLAKHYPDVRFIIPHLSSFMENWRAQRAFLGRLESYPNIHTDTSGVRFFDLLERAVQFAGPHKILFGSDGPWLHPGVELAKVRALRLSKTEEALVLGENFLRLIGRVAAPDHLRSSSTIPTPRGASLVQSRPGHPCMLHKCGRRQMTEA